MYKIANALIVDDKIDLTLQNNNLPLDNNDYKSLISIQKYFMRNSIPFSVVNRLSESFVEAVELMKSLPKPDLLVLDLDLNSDGEIDDSDVQLVKVILTQLVETFGDFILLIYSSQVNSWPEIKADLIDLEPRLTTVLQENNVIIIEKFFELTMAENEKLGSQIIEKQSTYFTAKMGQVEMFIKSNWNSEVSIMSFFFISFILLIHLSLSGQTLFISVFSLMVILVVTIKFSSQYKDHNQKLNENEHTNKGD